MATGSCRPCTLSYRCSPDCLILLFAPVYPPRCLPYTTPHFGSDRTPATHLTNTIVAKHPSHISRRSPCAQHRGHGADTHQQGMCLSLSRLAQPNQHCRWRVYTFSAEVHALMARYISCPITLSSATFLALPQMPLQTRSLRGKKKSG